MLLFFFIYAYKSSKCLFFLICIYRYKLLDFCRNEQVNNVMESVRWAATIYCVSCPGGSPMLRSLYQTINYIHEFLRLTDQPWLAQVVAPLSSAFAVTRMRRPTTLFSCRPSALMGPAMAAPFTSCGAPSTRVHAANGKTTMWSAESVWRANSWSTTTLPSECSETGAGNSWMLYRLPLQWSSGGWTLSSMCSERANGSVDWINVRIWEALDLNHLLLGQLLLDSHTLKWFFSFTVVKFSQILVWWRFYSLRESTDLLIYVETRCTASNRIKCR